MQGVCVGLLLFSVAWAAATFQPQTEKTKQGCVEEQPQEEKNRHNITLHHSDTGRNQEPLPKENTAQERKKNVSLSESNENNQSSKPSSLLAHRQTLKEDYSITNKENVHNDLKMSMYLESPGNNEADNGDDAVIKLHDQEEYSAALIRKNTQPVKGPVAVMKLLGEANKKNKPRNVLHRIAAGVNYATAHSKDKKNPQRHSQVQNSPVKAKSSHHIQRNTGSLKHPSKVKKIPSDFEGSGYSDLQGRGDNDISSFSGDGQPFQDIPGKGGAIGPDLEGMDIQTRVSGTGEAETLTPDTRGPGHNEIPEREENGGNAIGTRDQTARQPGAVDVSLVEGSNDIIGSTNFKELPGKEGNRVSAGSQNAHQGRIEFHYPHTPSKEKRKEGSRDVTESSNYNEIPKNGKGSTRKGTEHSNRNQAGINGKQRFSSKGKSQGQFIPSHGLDNEVKNEIGSRYGPDTDRDITHSRKYHYAPHRPNNSVRNNGIPQRKGPRGYRRPHSHGGVSCPGKDSSSESSDSGSSSESDGD
uniref:Matrix extracellular phosphoglycoprotein n=1 Tax=Otolemur garnettii TaxID=30611 RepID=D6C6L5_OTOGA|nr:matrix extracellular phosphoglycoprotein [Otolemur garnettii]